MLGSTYSLVAIGYTLIFGVLNLLHFAHGEVFVLGALIGTALVGLLIERAAIRPIKSRRPQRELYLL